MAQQTTGDSDNTGKRVDPDKVGKPADSDTVGKPADSDKIRAVYGVFVILIGVAGLVAALVAVLYWRSDATGGTILGIITSPIAAIVASYFGVSAAREAAEEAGAAKTEAGLAEVGKEQSINMMASKLQVEAQSDMKTAEQAAAIAKEAADQARAL